MSPGESPSTGRERFQRIQELYHAALEAAPEERAALLARIDPELRREVESLLSSPMDEFLDRPAIQNAPELLGDATVTEAHAGACLGPYRLESKLGEGGMGVVFRAVDTRLGRAVAVKTTQARFSARFEREARAIASLNHPNICTLHDVGPNYLVMELVEGETLAARLKNGPLPIQTVLLYGSQIAAALVEAHGKGIVHRDLKPANIMVGNAGVKVLDFGLATCERAPGQNNQPPTIQPTLTEAGMVMGTSAYMSPEQAEGKRVDARSDVFSFGAVLYEMLTGQRAFQRASKVSTLAAILREEPKRADGLPPDLEKILTRCLRKDPERRFQHADDLKVALEELKEESESGRLAAVHVPVRKKSRGARIVLAAAGVVLVASVAVVVWQLEQSHPPTSGPALTRLTSDPGLSFMPALSPDGRLLAYASDRSGEGNLDIWVKQVAGGDAVRLTRHPAADLEPAFSPDGTRVAFRSERDGRGIYVVSALGGDERRIADHGYQPRWSPDGQWISYGVNTPVSNLIYAVPSNGGPPRQLAPELVSARPPVWSPDGKHILCLGSRDEKDWDWWTAPLEGGQAVRARALELFRRHRMKFVILSPFGIGSATWPVAWSPEGNQILFSNTLGDNANIWALSLSPRTWEVTGAPQQLTFGAGDEFGPSIAAGGVTGRRLLAFANVASNTDVWSLPVDHGQGKARGQLQRLTRDVALDHSPFPSADGRRVAFVSNRSGNDDVWLKDLAGGGEVAITVGRPAKYKPVMARDGSRLAYMTGAWLTPEVYVVPVGPSGQPGVTQHVCHGCGRPNDWSPDGSKLLYASWQSGRGSVAALDVATGARVELLQSKSILRDPHLSPDGAWILFHEEVRTGEARLWVAPYREAQPVERREWIQVSGDQGQSCWAPDGNLLYMISSRDAFRCIWAQRLDPATKHPRGTAFAVQHFHGALSMIPITDGTQISLNAATGRLFFSLVESSGNIWLKEMQR